MPAEIIATKPADEAETNASLADTIANATNAQIDGYIDANVTDLASARAFLKRLAKIVRGLVRRELARDRA